MSEPTETEVKLWDLLDDIDTAFDRFKPVIEEFEKYVYDRTAERHKLLYSDGHKLFKPD